MEKEEIELFIEKLNEDNLEEDAYLGFFNVDYEDYKYIKANPKGLRRYAARLLQISVTEDYEYWYIDDKFIDKKSHHQFDSVELTNKNGETIEIEEPKTSWKTHLLGIGLYLLLTIIAICFIIGLITAISWIF
ncbi:hypothetical protein [Nonlabens ulvanivorans]|uniref:hypothetical protein n=1 Tax=Nonlabens ulvanivorans TaxID=906888 RepID=UPI002943427B|nr:hypothetical protein [Nonlabens ulvanivorans]WOI22198.1 hypothetical protein R1T42_11040 [Nonlabens ulvanivorans]